MKRVQKDGIWTPMKAGVTVGMNRTRLIADAIDRAIQIAEEKHARASGN